MNTLWDLKESLKYEKRVHHDLSESVKKWKDIVDTCTLSNDVQNLTNNGYEWKVRYECQKSYNQMILKSIQRMRAELRMLRCGVELSPFKDEANRTLGELRTQIKNLKIEKCSIISLLNMYEHQLDMESMAYFRSREALEELAKDVKNTQMASIRDQEKEDQQLLANLETGKNKRRLKPIAKILPIFPVKTGNKTRASSYSDRFMSQREHGQGRQINPQRDIIEDEAGSSDFDEYRN